MSECLYSSEKYHDISTVLGVEKFQFSISEKINGFRSGDEVFFGIYAPFWYPNFIKNHSDYLSHNEFAQAFVRNNEQENIKITYIRLPPSFYDHSIDLLEFFLIKQGFIIENIALWQTIPLMKYSSSNEYEADLKHSARKVLKKFSSMDVIFEKIENNDYLKLKTAFSIVEENRLKKGLYLKYNFDYLTSLIEAFPDLIKVFTLKINGKYVASAICHQSADNILYVAAWGDSRHALLASPMYTFASKLIDFSINANYDYLDFGISSDLRSENEKLFSFKRNIGCTPYTQKTLKRQNF